MLNVNDLANALKPAVLPGEALRVKVIREGKEAEQGVGYLDDGTMIVVEGGRERIGEPSRRGHERAAVAERQDDLHAAGLLSAMPGETWAVVVAAGSGDRLAADRPKAFVRLGGRTMLAWSLAMLDDHDLIDGIVMVVPEEYEERASLLADDLCATKIAAAVAGGATRPESVAAGLALRARQRRRSCSCTTPRGRSTPPEVVDRVVAALRAGAEGAVPALPRGRHRQARRRPTAASPRRSTAAPCAPCRRRRAFRSRCCARRSRRDARGCDRLRLDGRALGRPRRLRRGRRARLQGHDARRPRPRRAAGRRGRRPGRPEDVVLTDVLMPPMDL